MTNELRAHVPVLFRRISALTLGGLLVVGMLLAGSALAGSVPVDGAINGCGTTLGLHCRLVLQSAVEVAITRSEIEAVFGSGVELVAGAAYGELRFESSAGSWHTVYFQPVPDFWSVGLDRLTIRTRVGAQTLLLVAADHRDNVTADSFEEDREPAHDPDFRFKRAAEAAFEGDWGLRLWSSDDDAWIDAPLINVWEGEGQQGQHTEVGFCPPEGAGPSTDPDPTQSGTTSDGYGPAFTILEGWTDVTGAYEVLMRRHIERGKFGISVRLVSFGGTTTEAEEWATISGGPHRLTARAWTVADTSGVHVLVDDRLVQSVAAPVTEAMVIESIRLGMVATPAGAPVMDYDALRASGGFASQGMIPVRADDFEDGSLDDWSVQTPAAIKTVSTSNDGGAGGDAHLAFELPVPALLLDDRPAAEARFALRVGLDASDVHGPAGSWLKILDVRRGDNHQGGSRFLKLFVQVGENGERSVVLHTLGAPDDGGWVESIPVALPADANAVVVEWRRAYEAANTGYVRLWTDGQLTAELSGLANQDQTWGSYRVGVINSAVGLYGSLKIDNVVAWEPAPIVAIDP